MSTASATNTSSSFKDGPYVRHTLDSGTCGNTWAEDVVARRFIVTLPANPDGSYTVKEKFLAGMFLTHGSLPHATTPPTPDASPVSCQAGDSNTLREGVSGTYTGTYNMTVPASANPQFNPNGSCALDSNGECQGNAWFQAFFGVPLASVVTNSFTFTYNAPTTLCAHQWVNASTGSSGDIASTCSAAASGSHARLRAALPLP